MSEASTRAAFTGANPERITSVARVGTDRAARYGKQLAAHLGRRAVSTWDAETGTGSVAFAEGQASAQLRGEADALVMELDSTPEEVARYEDVLGRHLVRFGVRDELVCAWQRSDGTDGTIQVAPAESE